MSKIICTLEHASDLINGVKFSALEGVEGKVSEEVSESVAALFLSIPGYVLHGAEGEDGDDTSKGDNPPPPPAPAETPAQRKARLKAEKEAAEKEAAEKAEAERKAAEEEAARKAAEGADGEGNEGEGEGEGENNEVF